jgi:hypothetical protein
MYAPKEIRAILLKLRWEYMLRDAIKRYSDRMAPVHEFILGGGVEKWPLKYVHPDSRLTLSRYAIVNWYYRYCY